MMTHTIVDSPIGPLTLVASDGRLSGLFMEEQRHRPDPSRFGERDARSFAGISEQLDAYFNGTLDRFEVELAVDGTEWQKRVWAGLAAIPYGMTISYGELAARLGSPKASRAVGLANGRNPVGIVVPCHRVVGSSGSLTGYGGGLERKRWLLDHERKVLAG